MIRTTTKTSPWKFTRQAMYISLHVDGDGGPVAYPQKHLLKMKETL